VGAKPTASGRAHRVGVAATDPLASLVVRVQPTDEHATRLVVTLADVCGDGAADAGGCTARATVEVHGSTAEIVSIAVVPPADGALTARLLDGVADALRARGVERVRISAELDL
jgi:hypothetical protein